jgi:hypothetical protein
MSHKLTEEEKEKQRQADIERLRLQTLENNKSFDPRLIRRPSVQLYSPTSTPGLVTSAAKETEEFPLSETGHAVENALVPHSSVEKPSELVRSEERPPTPAERIKPPSSIEESTAEKMLKLKRAADATKNNVRVTEQVFSCVTDYAIIRGIDKVNVVTYLLYAHLPKKGQSSKSTPEYLIKEPPEGPRNRDLTYFEDPGLTERLSWVSSTYGLPRVDIIENIILNNLPIVEKKYPPKRRRKRRRTPRVLRGGGFVS